MLQEEADVRFTVQQRAAEQVSLVQACLVTWIARLQRGSH